MNRRKKQQLDSNSGINEPAPSVTNSIPPHLPPSLRKDTSMSALLRRQPVWLLLAIASGACAAFNGVFAKLTTTSLTTSWSHALSSFLSLDPGNQMVNYALRAFFFGLNLLFNVAMWALFTAALTRASSTTRVSIVNVSSNFTVTALLGWLVFGERLPPLWWVGAGLLAAGNVVIGRREEEAEKKVGADGLIGVERDGGGGGGGGGREGEAVPLMRDEDLLVGPDIIHLDGDVAYSESTGEAVKKGEEVDAPLR
ncbi:hypothetical protein GJ744_002403 [Endocarpon pusillum]|uniref:EamA domain-containing protein n=1 Tax=Endocarpon pusillum TaxID=364733 RepID=A0A8H7ASI7_9EURO|nr:hypothetical protein GJ744_002403 [Endocarpon pusillum]